MISGGYVLVKKHRSYCHAAIDAIQTLGTSHGGMGIWSAFTAMLVHTVLA